jgi:cell wall-associated NlpC family hydrolase
MVTRAQIEQSARKIIGAPWHHQGRSLDGGLDCIGAIIFVGLDVGSFTQEEMDKSDIVDYSRNADAFELLVQKLRYSLDEIPIASAKEGDVVTFRLPHECLTSHVAVLVRGQREMSVIHSVQTRAAYEDIYRRWYRYATHAFRFRDLEDI